VHPDGTKPGPGVEKMAAEEGEGYAIIKTIRNKKGLNGN
jgi:hypothetical protein